MKFNWDQTGMPVSLVSRLGQRNEFAEFKTVLNDARDHVMQPVDAEAMAKELVQSGGREYVEMVRELTTALENTRKELEDANRRYERLAEEIKRRGIRIADERPPRQKKSVAPPEAAAVRDSESVSPETSEWDDWNRKFQSLLG